MSKKIPAIISTAYALFLGLFSLDVFSEGYQFPQVILALFMHLIPSLILLSLTFLSYKKPKTGSLAFIAISLIFTFFFKTYQHLGSFLLISLPLIIITFLFFISSTATKQLSR